MRLSTIIIMLILSSLLIIPHGSVSAEKKPSKTPQKKQTQNKTPAPAALKSIIDKRYELATNVKQINFIAYDKYYSVIPGEYNEVYKSSGGYNDL